MFRKILIGFFLSISFASSAQLSQKLDSLVQFYYKSGLFEGTALIADSSGIIFHKSFGLANHDHRILNTDSTTYRLGSIEKQFTAMLVLQLVEKGKLSLSGKINDYLPKYRSAIGNKVTIEQLLTHTSGIPNYTALPNIWDDSLKLSYDPQYILNHFCSGDLEFTPGTKYKYSNTGYFILAQIIEKVTGKSLPVVLKENILTPAGMNNTGLDDNITPIKNKALGYYRLADKYVNEPYIYVPNAKGAASIFSTAYDLYLWDRILYTNKLLSPEYLKPYLSSHFNVYPDYAYGYGWEFTRTGLSKTDTIKTMEHSGAIRAFRTVIFRIPSEKKCIILLSNCANQSAYSLFENIIHVFRDNNWQKPKILVADTLFSVMQKTSIENAIQVYKKLKITDSVSYDFSGSALEFFAERLYLFQNYEAAIAVFKLAIKENPGYIAAGYYQIGKSYEKLGKFNEAILAYQTVVTRDRKSRAGIDAAFQINFLKKY